MKLWLRSRLLEADHDMAQLAGQGGKPAKSSILACREREQARIALCYRGNPKPMKTLSLKMRSWAERWEEVERLQPGVR